MDEKSLTLTPTIGIECHVQLKSRTKLFSGVANDAREAVPNSLISHIDLGLPGALPVLNEEAVKLAARAAYAVGTQPQKVSHFDRKHYFYPDLPKGYQITQYEKPIIVGGQVDLNLGGSVKTIGITRAHLEEDAGKNIHPEGTDYSLVDLNRAGTPLLEIVSEPDISSAAEAKAFCRELYLLMKYADVSNVDLYHGNMRFDVNISLSADSKKGKRTEIKNLNSFRAVENAVDYEIKRQSEILQSGQSVQQETRGWDEAKQRTVSQRGKEEAEDYRYFPEPDVPPLELSEEFLDEVKNSVSLLPPIIRTELARIDIDSQVIEDILDRDGLVQPILRQIDEGNPQSARRLAFWLLALPAEARDVSREMKPQEPRLISALSEMVDNNLLSSTAAKVVFDEIIKTGESPERIAEKLNLLQLSDEAEISRLVSQVISANPKVVEDIKAGEVKAIAFLVGQAMKLSKGQADPQKTQQLIKKQLGI